MFKPGTVEITYKRPPLFLKMGAAGEMRLLLRI
jgi:hypothetical protein